MKRNKRLVIMVSVLLIACALCTTALAAPNLNSILGALRNTQGGCNTGGAVSNSCGNNTANAALQQLLQQLYGKKAASATSNSACAGDNTCTGNTCGNTCTGNTCTGGNACTGGNTCGNKASKAQQYRQQIRSFR